MFDRLQSEQFFFFIEECGLSYKIKKETQTYNSLYLSFNPVAFVI